MRLIQRPGTHGHIGEFIASKLIEIKLMESATNRAFDGQFTSGPLAGRSVDAKFYANQQGPLAIKEDEQPNYFLVLTGPRAAAASSIGKSSLCVIDLVYLFKGKTLADDIRQRGVKFGVATGVKSAQWEAAEIYPTQTNRVPILAESQRVALSKFGSKGWSS